MKKQLVLLLLWILPQIHVHAQDSTIDLSGTWNFKLDQDSIGVSEKWFNQTLPLTISLPGTTDEAHYGEKTVGSDFGILTRAYKYYGPAWYQKDIIIPEDWKGKRIYLFLERVMWQSQLFLNGKEVSVEDALSSPHTHDLGFLTPGKHRLTIRINNDLIYNIGDKGHVYTEYTQSIWNGAVGKIELIAKDLVRFTNPQVYTKTLENKSMTIVDEITNESNKRQKVKLFYSLQDRATGYTFFEDVKNINLEKGQNKLDYTALMPESLKLWNDVHPNLYKLKIEIASNKGVIYDTFEEEIGFREITTSKSKVLINGEPVFLRGNLDCVHFPLTGYPSCDVSEWERIFQIYKDYGLNHVRFHSWCPPKAAFIAADRMGLYLQPETIWLDWWMAIKTEGRKEMWTKGFPDGLGKNPSADEYVQKELRRMLDVYGNHASFALQCIGNELGNSDFKVMEKWVQPLRESDPRRLYSLSSARQIMPVDQFMATHYLPSGPTRGLRGGASTNWDFEDTYSSIDIPVIAHEIGQWPVYPKWEEIKKYKGTLKARNLEEFQIQARKNKIENQNLDFVNASGALNQIMYKYEIESFLRTPSCAGIQLLSMQDYQGQGEALIGWLDVFYDSKGITTPEKFKNHSDSTVTLLRMPKYVWENNENFTAEIQLAHYGVSDLEDQLYWKITDELSNVIGEGKSSSTKVEQGTAPILGSIDTSLAKVTKAQKLTVEVGLVREPIHNTWHIWVYPNTVKTDNTKGITIANRLDNNTLAKLQKGEKVLLDASQLGTEATSDKISFFPLYWSLTFFPGQGINTIGMLVQDKHPALALFPTDSHSDWQWQKIYKGARGFYINDFPEEYKPITQPIDDFHRNNKLAGIFEFKVGKGSLLVTGFSIQDEKNVVARQLKESLLNYMNSNQFKPNYEPDLNRLQEMFTYVEPLQALVTQEFSNPMLYIDCAANATKSDTLNWSATLDKVTKTRPASYEVILDEVYKSDKGSAWKGEQINANIKCPAGIIGTLHIGILDSGNPVDITFEGRNYTLNKVEGGKAWLKLHIMREDSNDKLLKLQAKGKQNGSVLISDIAIVEE